MEVLQKFPASPTPPPLVQLWGDSAGNIWKISHEMDYEQRVKRIILNNGDIIENVYDGMSRYKSIGIGAMLQQERDGSDTVTARYPGFYIDDVKRLTYSGKHHRRGNPFPALATLTLF